MISYITLLIIIKWLYTPAAASYGYLTTNDNYLAFLHLEIVDNDADEKVEREERAEHDKEYEIHVHIDAVFACWLLINLQVASHKCRAQW